MNEAAPAGAPRERDRLDTVLAALADGTRRDLLDAVGRAGTTTATELARQLPISRQAVAKHLMILRDAGLVSDERMGRETRYRFVPGSLRMLDNWVADAEAAWGSRLDKLRRLVSTDDARPGPDAAQGPAATTT